jgi:hypothetical protein
MQDGTPATGSQAVSSEAEQQSAPAATAEPTVLVGRLRRWSSTKQWGYVLSELHFSDLILRASEDCAGLEEGDYIIFEPSTDDKNQLSAKNARKASHEEVIALQAQLSRTYQNYLNRQFKVEHLSSGRSANNYSHVDGEGHSGQQRGHRREDRYNPAGNEALQPTAGALLPHMEQSLRPPPPPPVLPPAASHTSGSPEAFGAANVYHQVPHQGYAYNSYVEDGNYYQQGMTSPWQGEGVGREAMNMNTTISISEQIPGHAGVKLLCKAPPLLESGFNAKYIVACLKGVSQPQKAQTFPCRNAVASSIGRHFGELLRSTHQTFCHQSGEESMQDMSVSHQPANWDNQQWDWGWGHGHDNQMAHAPAPYGTTVGHAGMGHSVLSTQGDGMFPGQ